MSAPDEIPSASGGIVATKDEWAAMNGINKHFTFRERTAFLVGYRLAWRAATADALKRAEKRLRETDEREQHYAGRWAADEIANMAAEAAREEK